MNAADVGGIAAIAFVLLCLRRRRCPQPMASTGAMMNQKIQQRGRDWK